MRVGPTVGRGVLGGGWERGEMARGSGCGEAGIDAGAEQGYRHYRLLWTIR